jgi:hypothetical protein
LATKAVTGWVPAFAVPISVSVVSLIKLRSLPVPFLTKGAFSNTKAGLTVTLPLAIAEIRPLASVSAKGPVVGAENPKRPPNYPAKMSA